jgi:uncharacterized protein
MEKPGAEGILADYFQFLRDKAFPCVGAKSALASDRIRCLLVDHMACPKEDGKILEFLYDFVDEYRDSPGIFYSAAVLFREPKLMSEEIFDLLLWQRLQALSDLDAKNYAYDPRVNPSPASANFSFSLKKEAFFIVGLHSASSRPARQFSYPVLTFNPHAQFEKLRKTDRYERIKKIVRKRDLALSGNPNPMLQDFGKSSEVLQYSGRNYNPEWQCPLNIQHERSNHHPCP